jgi:hypothetical protein
MFVWFHDDALVFPGCDPNTRPGPTDSTAARTKPSSSATTSLTATGIVNDIIAQTEVALVSSIAKAAARQASDKPSTSVDSNTKVEVPSTSVPYALTAAAMITYNEPKDPEESGC